MESNEDVTFFHPGEVVRDPLGGEHDDATYYASGWYWASGTGYVGPFACRVDACAAKLDPLHSCNLPFDVVGDGVVHRREDLE